MEILGFERVTQMIVPWQNVRASLVNAHDSASGPATEMFVNPREQKMFHLVGCMISIHRLSPLYVVMHGHIVELSNFLPC